MSLYGFRCCYRRDRKENKALVKASKALEEEVDVVEMLRSMRLFKSFF